jgi:hypothetical protein
MRYLTILLALFIAAGTVAAFTVEQKSTDAAAESAASFKLVNDTDADVQIHTGQRLRRDQQKLVDQHYLRGRP